MASLATVCAAIESNNNPAAIRFEHATFVNIGRIDSIAKTLTVISELHRCSQRTAMMIAATSWGAYQIMGFNLFRLSALHTVFEYASDPSGVQLATFQRYTQEREIDFSLVDLVHDEAKLHRYAASYNGPVNVDAYAMRVLDEIRRQQPDLFS